MNNEKFNAWCDKNFNKDEGGYFLMLIPQQKTYHTKDELLSDYHRQKYLCEDLEFRKFKYGADYSKYF